MKDTKAGKTHFADNDTLEYIASLEADKKRLDFLESLTKRHSSSKHVGATDIRIRREQCSDLHCYGPTIEADFSGRGSSIREMIDDAIKNHEAKE